MTTATRLRSALLVGGVAAGTLLTGAPPASAAAVCDGDYVRTCINLRQTSDYYVAASASIRDTDLGSDYAVGVQNVTLQIKRGGQWEFFDYVARDRDGLHDVSDAVSDGGFSCSGYGTAVLRAKATMRWQRAGSATVTTEYVYSTTVGIPCWNGG